MRSQGIPGPKALERPARDRSPILGSPAGCSSVSSSRIAMS